MNNDGPRGLRKVDLVMTSSIGNKRRWYSWENLGLLYYLILAVVFGQIVHWLHN
jgi:hypothetical protein